MIYSGPAVLFYNGVPVLECQHVDLDVQTNNKSVHTMHKGRAGHSRGSKEIQLMVKNAVPLDGYEIDWISLANLQDEVELGLQTVVGKIYGMVGDVRDAKYTSSTEQPNELAITYSGIIVSET